MKEAVDEKIKPLIMKTNAIEKIIAIGDLHGRNDWMQIIAQNLDADKYVFVGDYFDTHDDISAAKQMQNFNVLIQVKKNIPDKVVLLIGNHDFHYLSYAGEQYSGYQGLYQHEICTLLQRQIEDDNLQMCYEHGGFIFTHAGISATWCKHNHIDTDNAEYAINHLFKYRPQSFKFSPGRVHNPYGDEIGQTPIWIRPKSLLKDKIRGYVQVVGHTTQEKIAMGEVLFIDTLGTSREYLELRFYPGQEFSPTASIKRL